MPPESSRTLHPVFAATPKLPPPAQRKHLTQQEKVAAVILYMKGSWQQDELAAELGVSGSAISRVVRECKKSASDHSLKGILVCEYLRPTPGIAHRVENRGNKRPRVVKRGEQGAIARANAPATALRKIAPRKCGCWLRSTAITSDWFEALKAYRNPLHPSLQRPSLQRPSLQHLSL